MGRVLIYTISGSRPCALALSQLREAGASGDGLAEVNLSEFPSRRVEMTQLSGGKKALPQVFFNDEFVGGAATLVAWSEDGTLRDRVAACLAASTPAFPMLPSRCRSVARADGSAAAAAAAGAAGADGVSPTTTTSSSSSSTSAGGDWRRDGETAEGRALKRRGGVRATRGAAAAGVGAGDWSTTSGGGARSGDQWEARVLGGGAAGGISFRASPRRSLSMESGSEAAAALAELRRQVRGEVPAEVSGDFIGVVHGEDDASAETSHLRAAARAAVEVETKRRESLRELDGLAAILRSPATSPLPRAIRAHRKGHRVFKRVFRGRDLIDALRVVYPPGEQQYEVASVAVTGPRSRLRRRLSSWTPSGWASSSSSLPAAGSGAVGAAAASGGGDGAASASASLEVTEDEDLKTSRGDDGSVNGSVISGWDTRCSRATAIEQADKLLHGGFLTVVTRRRSGGAAAGPDASDSGSQGGSRASASTSTSPHLRRRHRRRVSTGGAFLPASDRGASAAEAAATAATAATARSPSSARSPPAHPAGARSPPVAPRAAHHDRAFRGVRQYSAPDFPDVLTDAPPQVGPTSPSSLLQRVRLGQTAAAGAVSESGEVTVSATVTDLERHLSFSDEGTQGILFRFVADEDPWCLNRHRLCTSRLAIPATDVAAGLQRRMVAMCDQHLDETGKNIDYLALQKSDELRAYLQEAVELQPVDISVLSSRELKAFFINLYNAMVIHATIVRGPPTSALQRTFFFSKIGYNIGGMKFTLNAIEHGILRGNVKPLGFNTKIPFKTNDPRRHYSLKPDPRIHFALVCGAKSCPPIRILKVESLDATLDWATAAFVDDEVSIEEKGKGKVTAHISMIFSWFAGDFGGRREAVLQWICDHAHPDHPLIAAARRVGIVNIKVRYTPYDWSLNTQRVPAQSAGGASSSLPPLASSIAEEGALDETDTFPGAGKLELEESAAWVTSGPATVRKDRQSAASTSSTTKSHDGGSRVEVRATTASSSSPGGAPATPSAGSSSAPGVKSSSDTPASPPTLVVSDQSATAAAAPVAAAAERPRRKSDSSSPETRSTEGAQARDGGDTRGEAASPSASAEDKGGTPRKRGGGMRLGSSAPMRAPPAVFVPVLSSGSGEHFVHAAVARKAAAGERAPGEVLSELSVAGSRTGSNDDLDSWASKSSRKTPLSRAVSLAWCSGSTEDLYPSVKTQLGSSAPRSPSTRRTGSKRRPRAASGGRARSSSANDRKRTLLRRRSSRLDAAAGAAISSGSSDDDGSRGGMRRPAPVLTSSSGEDVPLEVEKSDEELEDEGTEDDDDSTEDDDDDDDDDVDLSSEAADLNDYDSVSEFDSGEFA